MASLAFRPHIRNGNEEFLDRVIDNYVYAENLIEEIEMAEDDDFSAEDSGSIQVVEEQGGRDRRFKCQRCPKKFSRHASLIDHVTKFHGMVRRPELICPICKAGDEPSQRTYASKGTLRTHLIKHHQCHLDEAQAHLDVVDKDPGQEQMEIGHLEFKSERAKIREVHRRQGLLQAQRTRRFR